LAQTSKEIAHAKLIDCSEETVKRNAKLVTVAADF